MMKTLVENFSGQLTEALNIGKAAKLTPAMNKISNVLICGLGGSGIGGSIVSELVFDNASVPVNVTKGYFIPAYVDQHTLVIISSYSGNTEETLNCLKLAREKKATICAITSGGKVQELCSSANLDCIVVPGGMPPRTCLGYSLTLLFFVLGHHKIISMNYIASFEAAIQLLNTEEKNILAEAGKIAATLQGKIPVIYATSNHEGIAIRLRQQLNENSKILCWHHVIPEMNHNELVGWTEKHDDLAVLFLMNGDEYSRNIARIASNKEVISKYAASITDIFSKGNSPIEKTIYMIHLGDWISVLLGELRGADLMEVNVINQLKSTLSKI